MKSVCSVKTQVLGRKLEPMKNWALFGIFQSFLHHLFISNKKQQITIQTVLTTVELKQFGICMAFVREKWFQ